VSTGPIELIRQVFGRVDRRTGCVGASVFFSIVALTTLRASGSPSSAAEVFFQLALVASFVTLSVLDLRLAVLAALFEFALGGAGGDWTRFGSVSGRIVIDAILVVRALVEVAGRARVEGRRATGRYGAHALAIAIAMPVVWMTIGLAHGNPISHVVGDGDGVAFLAFGLTLTLLIHRGEGRWLREAFFVACAANALLTAALFTLGATHAISTTTLRTVLLERLKVGGAIGLMPNGAFRLYLGSGLYLQVALAMTVWRLLAAPRSRWLWALQALLWVDVYATYTRGLWLGAVLSAGTVVVLGSRGVRRPFAITGVTVGLFGVVIGAAAAAGLSFPSYLASRISSITSTTNTNSSTPSLPRSLQDTGFESPGTWQLKGPPGPTLLSSRTAGHALAGAYSLKLVNSAEGADAYAYQEVTMAPRRVYVVEPVVDASNLIAPAASARGLLVWDVSEGFVYTTDLEGATRGWRRLSVGLISGSTIGPVEVRLYAPMGTVYWDDVRYLDLGPLSAAEPPTPDVPGLFHPIGHVLQNPGFETPQGWSLELAPHDLVSYRREHAAARTGSYGATLTNTRGARDDYLFQNLHTTPSTIYVVSARVQARRVLVGAAGNRGLLAWDAANGHVYHAAINPSGKGWKLLTLTFVTGPSPGTLQVRLYAPQGTVLWDDVRVITHGLLNAGLKVPPEGLPLPPTSSSTDTAGGVSNHIKIVQARVLWRHIRERPFFGFGFGTIASDYQYGHIYSYELTYLDILFKTGFVGLLFFLSFPLRLIWDALRVRFGRLESVNGTSPHEAAVVVAIVLGVLLASATDPYLVAAFGLCPILVSIAWLEPRHPAQPNG
jgi:hypothetical protein